MIQKYNVPGPRYTSYPTVPYWNEVDFSTEQWVSLLKKSFNESNSSEGISLYIHLPYCENMCSFCGCNKKITKNHNVEKPYIDTLLKEWDLYLSILNDKPKIKEIHLGGGTPTFFSADNLVYLINELLKKSVLADDFEFSFEGHPNNTTYQHLDSLYKLGFRRVSFGIQDYDPIVQKTINRIQPFENVEKVHNWAKEIGYTSIGHDLVFGLPKQTIEGMTKTIKLTNDLKPDRLSFYSYAHVPWIKGNGQRGFNEDDLPKNEEKRALYNLGKELFEQSGYKEVGMDHFALETDSLYKSFTEKTMHRNFMGYSSSKTQVMIGLGVSSISDSWYAFAQNSKTIEEYQEQVNNNILPIFRGHILTQEDLFIRTHILAIMCQFQTSWKDDDIYINEIKSIINSLQEMQKDGLIIISDNKIEVTEQGIPFIRNVCMAFDLRMLRKAPETKLFSMTI